MTAPYFRDGSQATLWDVMDHYNKGDGIKNPHRDADIRPLALSEPEIDVVVAFMATLTSAQYRDPAAAARQGPRLWAETHSTGADTVLRWAVPAPRHRLLCDTLICRKLALPRGLGARYAVSRLVDRDRSN